MASEVAKSLEIRDLKEVLIRVSNVKESSKLLKELNGTSKKIDYMTNNLKEWLQKWMLNN